MSEFWEERYARAAQAGQLLFPRLASDAVCYTLDHLLPTPRPDAPRPTAIDVGAGEGRHARELARHGYQVTATEVSQTAVKNGANRFAKADGLITSSAPVNLLANDHYDPVPGVSLSQTVTWEYGDCRTWSPAEPVDLVLGAFIHQIPGGIFPVLPRFAQWIHPGGKIALVGHARQQFGRPVGGPQKPEMLWVAAEIATTLSECGLNITFAKDLERPEIWELMGRELPENLPPITQLPAETIVVAEKPL